MGPVDIAVIVVVSVAALAAIGYLIYRKIKHKGGCCDCSSCNGNCGCCHSKDEDQSNKE